MQEDLALPPEMEMHAPQSRLMWMVSSLGTNAALLSLVALVAFIVVLILILRGRGPAMVGAILLIVPLPLYVALLGAEKGTVASFAVIALSDVQLKQSELFAGLGAMLVSILVAILLTMPAFLLATIGLTVQALRGEPPTSQTALAVRAVL